MKSGSHEKTASMLKMKLKSASRSMSDATTTQNQARGRGNGIEIFMSRKVHAPDGARGYFARKMNRLDHGFVFQVLRGASVTRHSRCPSRMERGPHTTFV
jgi:hypothetical protein